MFSRVIIAIFVALFIFTSATQCSAADAWFTDENNIRYYVVTDSIEDVPSRFYAVRFRVKQTRMRKDGVEVGWNVFHYTFVVVHGDPNNFNIHGGKGGHFHKDEKLFKVPKDNDYFYKMISTVYKYHPTDGVKTIITGKGYGA